MENCIYGIHAVLALLKKSPIEVVGLCVLQCRDEKRLQEILQIAKHNNIVIEYFDRHTLSELVKSEQHQGIVAKLANKQKSLSGKQQQADLIEHLQQLTEPAFVLVLDGVQDPHNLGACLRSADAAGVHAVICPKDNAVGITPTVQKVACGAAETVNLYTVTNLARTLKSLQDLGIWIYGAAVEGEKTLYDIDYKGPVALVLGAEGKGLRRLTRENCDELFQLPMNGYVESLNVSVATGICLYEVVRQRSL